MIENDTLNVMKRNVPRNRYLGCQTKHPLSLTKQNDKDLSENLAFNNHDQEIRSVYKGKKLRSKLFRLYDRSILIITEYCPQNFHFDRFVYIYLKSWCCIIAIIIIATYPFNQKRNPPSNDSKIVPWTFESWTTYRRKKITDT